MSLLKHLLREKGISFHRKVLLFCENLTHQNSPQEAFLNYKKTSGGTVN